MKVSKEHYTIILNQIKKVQDNNNLKKYLNDLKINKTYKDLKTRFIWDLFHASGAYKLITYDTDSNKGYSYTNNHLETTIIKACKDLKIETS